MLLPAGVLATACPSADCKLMLQGLLADGCSLAAAGSAAWGLDLSGEHSPAGTEPTCRSDTAAAGDNLPLAGCVQRQPAAGGDVHLPLVGPLQLLLEQLLKACSSVACLKL